MFKNLIRSYSTYFIDNIFHFFYGLLNNAISNLPKYLVILDCVKEKNVKCLRNIHCGQCLFVAGYGRQKF